MARYKYIDTSSTFIPVDLVAQLLPGTFENALCHSTYHQVDHSVFDKLYRIDLTVAHVLVSLRQLVLVIRRRIT